MSKRTLIALVAVALGALLVAGGIALAQSGGGYDLSWNSVDGGGGSMSGGDYALTGTVGQADAGATMSGGDYALQGGFWNAGTVPVVLHLPILFRN